MRLNKPPSYDEFSLDDMLGMIIEDNNIKRLNLIVYDAIDLDEEYDVDNIEPSTIDVIEAGPDEFLDKLNKLRETEYSHLIGIGSNIISRQEGYDVPAHLFLLDFGCFKNRRNVEKAKKFVKEIGLSPGFLLDSGKSYHFYFNGVVDSNEWERLLDESKRLGIERPRYSYPGLIHINWVDFQLKRGYSVLRLSKNYRKPKLPKVIEAIGYKRVDPDQLAPSDVDSKRLITRIG